MIYDLLDAESAAPQQADIVVVGAGIAGLIVATRLAKAGKRVIVLESGGLRQEGETHPLNATEQIGQHYKGSDEGRFRCLGGTSTRWGGALIPFQEENCSFHPLGWDADWLGVHSELLSYLNAAESLFALPRSTYSAVDVPNLVRDGELAFFPRLAKWPAFSKRNVAHLLSENVASIDGPQIWLNATVKDFGFHPDGKLASLTAQAPNGRTFPVCAPQFVFAAGAIESTRLLLLADRVANDRVFAPHDVLGRYFHDHIADTVGQFTEIVPRGLNQITGFRFEEGGMRNLRFEPSGPLRRKWNMPAAFAHISFAVGNNSPVDGLRQILRAIQRRELPDPSTFALLFGSSGWLLRAVWWRLVKRRLLFPDDVRFTIDLVVEQEPNRESRIDLSSQLDPYGLPLARINWQVSQADRDNILKLTEMFARAWSESPLANIATLELLDATRREASPFQSGGVYHPGGSTRLGRSARDGVVDRDLRAFGIPNLTVVATSVFPTGGGANPTMMLILASLRAADRIASETSH